MKAVGGVGSRAPLNPSPKPYTRTGQAKENRVWSSTRLFWMGVPEMTRRWRAGSECSAWLSCVLGFLMM